MDKLLSQSLTPQSGGDHIDAIQVVSAATANVVLEVKNHPVQEDAQSVARSDDLNSNIEMLRAVAVLFVLYSHFLGMVQFGALAKAPQILELYSFAYGVDLFFCISGYVVTRSLLATPLSDLQSVSDQMKFYGSFLIRRFFRLAPSAYLWAFIMLAYSLALPAHETFTDPLWIAKEVLGILIYAYNFFVEFNILFRDDVPRMMGYYWSLALEWQFYLILPLMAMFIRERYRIALVCAGIVFFALCPNTERYTWFRVDGFLWGILLAHLFRFVPNHGLIARQRLTKATSLLLGLAGAVAYLYCLRLVLLSPHFSQTYLWPLLGVTSALCVTLAIAGFRLTPFSTVNAAFDWIGKRSYSIYLIHLPVFYVSAEINAQLPQAIVSATYAQAGGLSWHSPRF